MKPSSPAPPVPASSRSRITLRVNGEPVEVYFESYKTLLEVLREDLALLGEEVGPGIHTEASSGDASHQQCIPTTCTQAALECGAAPDGCGGKLECGTCTAPGCTSPRKTWISKRCSWLSV